MSRDSQPGAVLILQDLVADRCVDRIDTMGRINKYISHVTLGGSDSDADPIKPSERARIVGRYDKISLQQVG